MRRLALLLAIALVTAGCHTTTRTEMRSQRVTLDSSPPGATIQVLDPSGNEAVGRTPVAIEIPYVIEHREIANSVKGVNFIGLTVGTAFLTVSTMQFALDEPRSGTNMLLASLPWFAISGGFWLISELTAGPKARSADYTFRASHPGYAPLVEPHSFPVDEGFSSNLHFKLQPTSAPPVDDASPSMGW